MKNKNYLRQTGWIFGLFFIAAAAFLLPMKSSQQEVPPRITDLGPLVDSPKPSHPKLQSVLSRLAEIASTQGLEKASKYAAMRKINMRGDSVRIVTEAETDLRSTASGVFGALARKKIESLGGVIETSYRQLIQHNLPLAALNILADDPSVRFVRLPLKPVLLDYISEGVSYIGADSWRNLEPYRNDKGAKICILDAGFGGYTSLLGTELPSSVTARSFRADGDIFAGIAHGTACAEIVHDVAPKAKLYLVNFETDVEQHNALSWLRGQGVQVISYSLGWFNAGAGDGTGPICEDVENANNLGIAWASAAGNNAVNHWDGYFNDPDGDGWLNFSGNDKFLEFHLPAYWEVGVFLNWKDWGTWNGVNYGGSDQDFDLYLYIWNGLTWQLVDKSDNSQTGTQWPTEEIYGWYADRAATWAVAIKKYSATKNVRLELVTYETDEAIEYYVSPRSITVPADARSAIACGAVSWSNDAYHYYSSQGPTYDGRIKPDFASPSGVSTATYGPYLPGISGFFGTSTSAPHVAGAIGLIKSNTPYSIAQIKTLLEKRAVDLGEPGKDNKFGWGRLNVKK
jgi:hypothetical protein